MSRTELDECKHHHSCSGELVREDTICKLAIRDLVELLWKEPETRLRFVICESFDMGEIRDFVPQISFCEVLLP